VSILSNKAFPDSVSTQIWHDLWVTPRINFGFENPLAMLILKMVSWGQSLEGKTFSQ